MSVERDELLDSAGVADLTRLALSTVRTTSWRAAHDFPAPAVGGGARGGGSKMWWWRGDIVAWAADHADVLAGVRSSPPG